MPNFIKEYISDIKCQINLYKDKKDKIKILDEKLSKIKSELELKIDEELKLFFNLQTQNYDDY